MPWQRVWCLWFVLILAVATILTYPIQVAQTNMRAASKDDDMPEYKNTLDCLIKIFRADGFLGWYKGIFVKLIQTVLTTAFQFLAYEKVKEAIFALLGGEAQLKLKQ